jgi:tRNA (guanosine-2'-O-)-methyltransferase
MQELAGFGTTERRLGRMRGVLAERLGLVRCAVEAVYHRHNVSAILRTCDALGVHDVHLVAGPEMKVSPGPARGAERWLAVHPHASVAEAFAALRAAGCRVYVADLPEEGRPGDLVEPEGVPIDRPACLWFGAEVLGVSPEARALADGVVTLPMRGMAQSLNVSVAAALALRAVTERARALGRPAFLAEERVEAQLAEWLARDAAVAQRIASRPG